MSRGSGAEPNSGGHGQSTTRCESGTRAEYPMPQFLNLFENSEIHGAHDLSDSQRLLVTCRQGFERRLRFRIVLMGSCGFEMKQFAECVAFLPLEDCLIGAAELIEIFLGEIDAALGCVGSDVPENVCQLKGEAERDGIVLCPGRCGAEDMEADQSHDRRNTIAVEREVLKRGIPRRREIH